MKITRTITIDGSNQAEFEQIKAHLEALKAQFPQWNIIYDPLAKRATAISTEEVESLWKRFCPLLLKF